MKKCLILYIYIYILKLFEVLEAKIIVRCLATEIIHFMFFFYWYVSLQSDFMQSEFIKRKQSSYLTLLRGTERLAHRSGYHGDST